MKEWQEHAERGWELLSNENSVQWFASKEEHARKRVMGGRLGSVDALIGTVRNAEALGWNLYLQLNPSRPHPGRKKLAREDITHWRYVVVDLDPTEGALTPPNPPWDWVTVRLFSGRGYQFWISVYGVPEIGTEVDSGIAERMMNGYLHHLTKDSQTWAPGWRIDTACSDLARVVRCPGSVNQKTGRRAEIEAELHGTWLRSDDLWPSIALEPPPVEPGVFETLLDVLPHMTGKAREFVLYGVEAGERHNACYAACRNLHELGVCKELAETWLTTGAFKCYSDLTSMALSPAEALRILNRVYDA